MKDSCHEHILGCLVSVAWMVVLHLQDEAYRTSGPYWHASYSGKQTKEDKEVLATEVPFILASEPSGTKLIDCHSTVENFIYVFELMLEIDILPLAT